MQTSLSNSMIFRPLRVFLLLVSGVVGQERSAARTVWVPGFLLNPEMGVGLGFQAIHRPAQADWGRFNVKAIGTTRRQFQAKGEWIARPQGHEGWEGRVSLEGMHYPETFYGIGQPVAGPDREGDGFLSRGATAGVEATFPVTWNLRALLGVAANHYALSGIADSASEAFDGVRGWDGGTWIPWTVGAEWDSRDEPHLPAQGWHGGLTYGRPLAGDFSYGLAQAWLTQYASWGGRVESAWRVSQSWIDGHPPFSALPVLGDRKTLRGLPDKRIRDFCTQSLEAEIRYGFPLALPYVRRWLGSDWQMAAFTAWGRGGRTIDAAMGETPLGIFGIGGRLILKERLGALRGDLAFGGYGPQVYIDLNQAF